MKPRYIVGASLAAAAAAVAIWLWASQQPAKPAAVEANLPTGQVQSAEKPSAGAQAPEQFLLENDPVGTLRLEGRVVTPDETPVAGATVALRSQPAKVVTTEDDGSFVFEGLVARQYQLVARSPQGVAGPVNVRMSAATEPVTLVLRAAANVAVHVADSTGKAVAGAQVALRDIDVQTATTDQQGVAGIAPVVEGYYQLVVLADGFGRSSQIVAVTGATVQVNVTLGKGAAISGKVVSEAGAPVAGARVLFSGASDWSMQADDRHDAVITDAAGRFTIAAMPANSYRLLARHPAFAPATSELVTLANNDVRDVVLTLPAGATVAGKVVDAAGAPVAGARVRLATAVEGAMFEMPRQAFAADDGTFEFRGVRKRAHNALAIADAGASDMQVVDTTAGDATGVVIAISVTGAVAGVVVDAAGEPVEGAQVTVMPDWGTRGSDVMAQIQLRGIGREISDVDGRFAVSGMMPGAYKVRAVRSQHVGRDRGAGEGVLVEVGKGTAQVRVVLPPEAAVKGKVALKDGSAPGPFSVDFGMSSESFVNADGSFEITGLAPRDYKFGVRGATFDLKVVGAVLEAGKTTDLGTIVVAKGRRIVGRVVQGGAPVVGATVYVGNQLFGSGSSAKAEFGMMTRGMRDTTTNDKGEFSLAGVGLGSVSVLAEHAERGRSIPIELKVGDPRESDLTVDLLPFGALGGIVRQGGKVAENVFVSAQSVTAPDALFNVASGPDGAYRFDKLAPDTYKVSAALGMPMTGMQFFSKTIAVKSGATATLDVEVEKGTLQLTTTLSAPDNKLGGAVLYLIAGTVAAKNGAELARVSADVPSGFSSFRIYMGQPVIFKEMQPGAYTLCAIAYPIELAPMDSMAYGERHGDDMPVFCKGVKLAADMAIELPVVPPPLMPD